MNNEKEIERMLQFSNYCKPKSGDCEVCLGCDQYNLVKALINAGIGDKKQAVKEFAKRVVSKCEAEAVYAEWKDNHGEYGGDMVGIGMIEDVIDELFTELYGADE